jgi:hypothetical protein
MWPFVVAIVAILAWAFTRVVESGTRGGAGAPDPRLEEALREMLARLEEAEADRVRLRQRVENLEAIVASEQFELDREARQALGAAPPPTPRLTLDEPEAEPDEEPGARAARRVRGS